MQVVASLAPCPLLEAFDTVRKPSCK